MHVLKISRPSIIFLLPKSSVGDEFNFLKLGDVPVCAVGVEAGYAV